MFPLLALLSFTGFRIEVEDLHWPTSSKGLKSPDGCVEVRVRTEDSFTGQGGPWGENKDLGAFYTSEKERPYFHVTRGYLEERSVS